MFSLLLRLEVIVTSIKGRNAITTVKKFCLTLVDDYLKSNANFSVNYFIILNVTVITSAILLVYFA